MRHQSTKLGVIDFETDPFQYGRIPKPFAVEFYADDHSFVAWGDDCADKLANHLDSLQSRYLIYAHNGGKFDFHFLHKYIDNPVRIINSRIVSAKMFRHTLRDSFAIIPVALKAYAKDDIDYTKLESDVREKHKDEILRYLHSDCVNLFKLVSAFVERFGTLLTVGATAMKELQKIHTYDQMSVSDDSTYRQFYYGGRVECFKSGLLTGPYIGLDINSSYPYNMKHRRHPNGGFNVQSTLPDNFDKPYFAVIEATNRGALPIIQEHTLEFNSYRNIFFACSHEIEIAMKWGLIDIHKVETCHVAIDYITFEDFVDKFYYEKVQSKLSGDKIGELFAKFMLNSCYGKFGQNPENYSDWLINRDWGLDTELREQGYIKEVEYDDFELWARAAEIKQSAYYNVAIAASITSGARASLLDGLQHADNPVYCDTDSIICTNFRGNIDPHSLGAWKNEFTADHIAIAGKKLYAAYNGKNQKVKLASKGGHLSVDNIIAIASGNLIRSRQDAPVFSLHSAPKFLERNFKMTVDSDTDMCDNNDAD